MVVQDERPSPPSSDKRWRLVDAAARRYGNAGHALIECLHTAQESFGYLDAPVMRYVARLLGLPLSKVYGVATFYHFFALRPPGQHTCVVCMGTACYIKGAPDLLKGVRERYGIDPGQTTADGQLSLILARCVGACGLAPVAVFDGEIVGKLDRAKALDRIAACGAAPSIVRQVESADAVGAAG